MNSWLLVPQLPHEKSSYEIVEMREDLSTFFEYVDEIVLKHGDRIPDENTNEEQLAEVAKENLNTHQYLIESRMVIWIKNNEMISKIDPLGYAASVHIEIFAPPPNLV